jgi:hypothetical protein
MSAKACSYEVQPEDLFSVTLRSPLFLIKLLDSRGRWCGRLCCSSPSVIELAETVPVDLLSLSTCAARQICVWSKFGHPETEYLYPFDIDAFPTHQPDGAEARLVNLLLVHLGATVKGKYDRVGLCQIRIDVWDSMTTVKKDVIPV